MYQQEANQFFKANQSIVHCFHDLENHIRGGGGTEVETTIALETGGRYNDLVLAIFDDHSTIKIVFLSAFTSSVCL